MVHQNQTFETGKFYHQSVLWDFGMEEDPNFSQMIMLAASRWTSDNGQDSGTAR
jgi:hypothetical protein